MINGFKLLCLSLTPLFLLSCGPSEINSVKKKQDSVAETIVRLNKYLIEQDKELILKYAQRHNWHLTQTDVGLYYEITQTSKGIQAMKGNVATIDYRVELLDGTYCYSSDSLGTKTFTIGSRQIETGIDDGILLLKTGESARFILPPHLGQGLTGDGAKIPPRSILVYQVKLIGLALSN